MSFLKKTVRFNIWQAIFTVAFALMLLMSRHIVRDMNAGTSTLVDVYFSNFDILDPVLLIVFLAVLYPLTGILFYLMGYGMKTFFGERRDGKLWVYFVIFGVIGILWIPYAMTYWPGGVYNDTYNSIQIALGQEPMTTHEPILYTLLWKLVFALSGTLSGASVYNGLKLFTILQLYGFDALLSAVVYSAYKKGIKRVWMFALTAIFAIFPLFPFYGISLWKDSIFGMVVFLYSWHLLNMSRRSAKDMRIRDIVLYAILTVLVIFLRNNGIFVAIFVSVITAIVFLCRDRQAMAEETNRKKLLGAFSVKLAATSLAVIVCALIVRGPVFDALGYNVDSSIESLGIPLQQTAFIVSSEGNVSGEDVEALSYLMPMESWRSNYSPINVDTIKFAPEFDRDYFMGNTGEFMKVYTDLIIHNPVKAMKGYLLTTMGFWDVFEASGSGYICNFHFSLTGFFMSDYWEVYTGWSWNDLVIPKHPISAAVWVWIMIFCVCAVMSTTCKHSRKSESDSDDANADAVESEAGSVEASIVGCEAVTAATKMDGIDSKAMRILAIMPSLGVWLTIMLAVPLAFSLRYVFSVFLCVPICLMAMFEVMDNRKV